MSWRSGEAIRADAGMGTVRALAVLLGTLLVGAGVVVVATNYSGDYSCAYDLVCHDKGGTEPTLADRAVASFGFGTQQGPDSELPGPEGTLLLAVGAIVLLLVLILPTRGAHDPVAGIRVATDEAPMPRPVAVEIPGPRQRVFVDRQ